MERIAVSEAGRHFDALIDRVASSGISVELERDNQVVARLSPAGRQVKVSDLNRIFASLPPLGEDAESFASDVSDIRRTLPRESDPWD